MQSLYLHFHISRDTRFTGPEESLFILVDQFEKQFEYRKNDMASDGGAEADRFVTLLLRAVEQSEIPIQVVLAMRSKYLGTSLFSAMEVPVAPYAPVIVFS